MKKNLWFICLMVFVCMFSFTAVWAQEKKTDTKQEEAAKAESKEMVDFSKQVTLFTQLVSYGEAKKDSLMIISAVRILDSLPFDGIAKPGTDEKSGARYERSSLLNQAKEYASGDQEVLAVVAKLQEVPEKTDVRGHHGGPHGGYHGGGYHHGNIHHCVWRYICGHRGCEWVCR